MSTRLFVGIDDTDNLDSRGTGYHARALCSRINELGLGLCRYVTRHQLLMSPLVPFTSHNSAACLVVENPNDLDKIESLCVDYLLENSAEGSDAGLCLLPEATLSVALMQFGIICKHRVVSQAMAKALATQHGIRLHGLIGTKDGLIGALAAACLCGSGNDGRLLWLAGMRDHAEQTLTLKQLFESTDMAVVQSREGQVLLDETTQIDMTVWPRAIWLGGEPCLIVEPHEEKADVWQVAAKNYLKQF
tara:strand:+ start:1073 stop:1813 length:741 start_codon:yes stop_codon:yes gene_type:complete